MIVPKAGVMVMDGADDISLHDLHVINITKQLDSYCANHLANLDAPSSVITLVIGMIHFAVQCL